MTIDEIKSRNSAAGKKFFDASQMRQWHSRVSSKVHEGPGGIFFVTSEPNYDGTVRLYSVRRFVPETGAIETASWGKYSTAASAQSLAKTLALLVRQPKKVSDES